MISYTVFDPDDCSGLTYRWYGGPMVYVHEAGNEIDAFEVDGGESPAPEAVRAAVDAHHATREVDAG